ncbi:MAG: 4Fe-4S ferredoxin, partial [Candidatus Marinimicrobia bacterium]|nr:4Fe-4S ferredoxin [Candidatus Neomarinimicrobiota bacterium]
MTKNESVYRELQQHLDKQAVSYPAAKDGSDIRILKHIFDPDEAKLATFLSWEFQNIQEIQNKVKGFDKSIIPDMLQKMLEKGGIEGHEKEGVRYYCNPPLVVGMYELQLFRLSKGFVRDFRRYTRSKEFGLSWLGTGASQMRTIPIEKAVTVKHQVATFDQVDQLLDQAEGPFVIVPCICREKSEIQGHSCKVTDRKETCLALGDTAQSILLTKQGRTIDREEARDIL